MAARHMKLALLSELLIYLAVGYALTGQGWTFSQTTAALLALALGIRGVLVAVTYGFALTWPSVAPTSLRVGAGARIQAMFGEWLALLAMSFAIPFEARLMGADRLYPPANGRLPLLLIHGYLANRGFWYWIRNRLEARGWVVATLTLEPAYTSIDAYADQIERRIEAVLAATGSEKLILLGHSMGGLASRAYLRKHGNRRVARLITLGTPHHGSRLASIAWGRNGEQMRIGSAWLEALNAASVDSLPDSVAVFSYGDNFVMPQESARLDGVGNIAVPAVGHVGMAISPAFTNTLADVLEAGEAAGRIVPDQK